MNRDRRLEHARNFVRQTVLGALIKSDVRERRDQVLEKIMAVIEEPGALWAIRTMADILDPEDKDKDARDLFAYAEALAKITMLAHNGLLADPLTPRAQRERVAALVWIKKACRDAGFLMAGKGASDG